ncbi:MAG: MFS transporter [Pseudomonadota bacterium]
MAVLSREVWNWAAPVTAMAVMSITLSLSLPLFALLMERLGASGTVIGLNHSVGALAMVVTAPLLPLILKRVGLIPLMLGSVLLLAFCTITIPLFQSVWWWALLRIGWGFAATAMFFGSEFWVVTRAPDHMRGRIVGGYVVVLSASYMLGPLLLRAVGIDTMLIYIIPTAIILLSAVPLILGRHAAPEPEHDAPAGIVRTLRFFVTDPLVLWGVVLFGVIEFGAMGLITVWGLRSGLDQDTAVGLAFFLAAGSLLFQFPIGWAADRFDRRRLLAMGAVIALIAPIVMMNFVGTIWALNLIIMIWGGTAVGFYSVALTELGARYRGNVMAQANAAVMLAYGLGALLTPGSFGLAMDLIPPDGLLWLAAVAAAAYLSLALVRLRAPARVPLDSETESGT